MKEINRMSVDELIATITGVSGDDARNLVADRDLSTLYSTDARHLSTYKGFGSKRSIKLAASIELSKRLADATLPKRDKVCDALDIWKLLSPSLKFLQIEEFHVVILGGRNTILKVVKIAEGRRSSCMVHSSDIFREAILEKACAVILVHNHPSGDPSPSPEDEQMTSRVIRCGDLLGIKVRDHVIVAADCYRSMRLDGEVIGFD